MTEQTRTQHAGAFDALRAHSYTLEVQEGPDAGKRVETSQRVIWIGTNPDCDLELDDRTASRFHARIEATERGHRLVDDSSKNGTFVSDLRVKDVILSSETTVRIGENKIRYTPGQDEVEIQLARSEKFGRMLGQSTAMREIFAILARVAPTDMTVLIEGESGTGKELIADAIHAHSKRETGPFIIFDCSAVAANLIESELFGHVKGAFTGATTDRLGAFERAHGGTLFLDEMGELPVDLQPKLLRALEQRRIRRVGDQKELDINVRIVAATNRNLKREVDLGQFRQDLFYRLAVIRVVVPPLRRRADDIPMLVQHFLSELEERGVPPVQVAYDTIIKLQAHQWPGNVRELRNFVERAALLSTGERLETKHLVPLTFGDSIVEEELGLGQDHGVDISLPFKDAKARLIDDFERRYWTSLLEDTRGNISAAARQAGVHRKSAEYLLKKLDLKYEKP